MENKDRPPLNANLDRQANDPLGGYYYQILHSVNAWLDLADDEILYLEGAEDFDTVSDDAATAVQVKDTQHNVTLRSQEVKDAINNYWELRANNPDSRVKFRLLTRSKIGTEQGNPFGTGKPGLQVWSRCSGDEATVTKISEFLQIEGKISDEVKDFLKKSEPQEIYELLIQPITWETNSKPASFVEQSIRKKLVHHGDRYSIPYSDAEKVVNHLLKEALTVATQEQNRELTREHFLKIFAENTRVSLPIQNSTAHQPIELKIVLDRIKDALIADSSEINIDIKSPIQNTIPPLYPDVTQRTNLLTSIKAKLQSEGIVVIHGGTGRGKTTLAKMTANSMTGPWFWLSFTNREPSQVLHHLHQLAIEISNQSSPVNIVLDDVNLQPQQLRKYEEMLGVVVYGVLERGAKLMITSQHKLPNNFILCLGASQSIEIHVPDFTISEIEQFAGQLGCPADDARNWAKLVQLHTNGHPKLVHAQLDRLREEGWRQPDTIEGILQAPRKVIEEREAARQLLTELPENHREFLYRLSLVPIEFRIDCALNIGEIPESIPLAGDVFSQLVGPWIDRVTETYYMISPLLTRAAEQVWSDSKIKNLHAQIADAILETRNLTPIEAWAVLTHSMAGQNKGAFIAVVGALMNVPEDNWKELSHEFSLLIHLKINRREELLLGDPVVNNLFRSLQHRIAVEVDPEAALKILENWDKETVPYEPHQLYLLDRLMLADQALMHGQASLSAKKIVDYLKVIIEITNKHKEFQEMYSDFAGKLKGYNTDKSNYFSTLFSFTYRAPNPKLNPPFLSDLIDALDALQPEIRRILLADFEDDSIDCRLLIDGVWLAESKLDNPNWTGCLQVFDKVIDKTIEWGYLHLAAASARGKAIIHDEYLHNPDTAHTVLQDIVSKVGAQPVIEEEQANVYFGQRNYQEALNIYERILPEWNPPSEQVNLGPLEEYRRAAICTAQLNDWERAATFFKDGAERTKRIEKNTERYIGLVADAGFANFKAGNYCDSIKLLNLALQEFGRLVEDDNKDAQYFTLKKCLAGTIKWMAEQERENYSSEPHELPAGLCSDPETNEKILALPDFPMGYAWLYLAQIEFKFGHDTSVLEDALQTTDRDAYPALNFALLLLEAKYDFRYKTFDNLPHRIDQLAGACESMKKHRQTRRGVEEKGIDSSPITDSSNFASVENIIFILGTSLLVQLQASIDMHDILKIWRTNSLELPIREHIVSALDQIESMLCNDKREALTAMKTQEPIGQIRLVAALAVIRDTKTSPNNLFCAHTLIATSLISTPWEDFVAVDMAKLFSAQWLEKIKFPAMLKTPMITVPQIEGACNSSGTNKRKIGKILLTAHPAVSILVPSDVLQRFRSWTESKQEQDAKTAKNPIAQRLIRAMEKPPHLTHEDVEVLRQSIEEGKIPIKFDSPFEPGESEKQ